MSQLPFKPTEKQISCANESGIDVRSLDPVFMETARLGGEKWIAYSDCMKQENKGYKSSMNKSEFKAWLIIGIIAFGLATTIQAVRK